MNQAVGVPTILKVTEHHASPFLAGFAVKEVIAMGQNANVILLGGALRICTLCSLSHHIV